MGDRRDGLAGRRSRKWRHNARPRCGATGRDQAEGANVGDRNTAPRSIFAPGGTRCFCIIDSSPEANVSERNDEADIPYLRIVPALGLTP